jgi:hypothetical protein
MPAVPERSPTDLESPYTPPRTGHRPLRGQNGAPLGVEPIARGTEPEAASDELARRARLLAKNAWRSTPPPAS